MSRLSRSSSGGGYHTPSTPGATSVWVGSQPSHHASPQNVSSQTAALRFSNDSHHKEHRTSVSSISSDNVTSPGEGQYFVVSVRDSTSSAEGDSGYRGSANFSPTSPREEYSKGISNHNHAKSLPSLASTGNTQYQPNYLQQSASGIGNTAGVGNTTGVGNMYATSGLLPPANSFGVLPQPMFPPQPLTFQQPLTSSTSLSPELLAASLGQTGLQDPQPLLSPLPYLGQPLDINAITAAMAANQSLLSPIQSPTSPVFMSPTLTSPLPSLPLSPPAFPTAAPAFPTAAPGFPLGQISLNVSAQPASVLNGHTPQPSFLHNSTPMGSHTAGDIVNRKRSNISTGSIDQGDDQTTSGVGSSVPSTPSDSSPTSPQYEHHDQHPLTTQLQAVGVPPCYDRPLNKDACLRCGKKVYAMEKVGPVKGVLYHKACFTCAVCRTTLTLQNFHHNDADLADLHVYCQSHKPTARANPVDAGAVGIQRALTAPRLDRINDQIRGGPQASKHVHLDTEAVSIRSAMCAPAPTLQTSIKMREGAWFREQRKSESMPPRDVVKHDGRQQRYEGSKSLYINT